MSRNKKLKIILKGLGGILALIVLLIVCIIVFLFSRPIIQKFTHNKEFQSSEWKDKKLLKKEVRLKMVDKLLDNYNLVGKSKIEINDLLGSPEETSYFKEYDYVYWLGMERGFISIDSEWLVLKFEKDIVTEAKLVRD